MKGRRHLAGVQHAQSPTGAGPHIEKSSSFLQAAGDHAGCMLNLFPGSSQGPNRKGLLLDKKPHQLIHRFFMQTTRTRVGLLRRQCLHGHQLFPFGLVLRKHRRRRSGHSGRSDRTRDPQNHGTCLGAMATKRREKSPPVSLIFKQTAREGELRATGPHPASQGRNRFRQNIHRLRQSLLGHPISPARCP